ncbi:MAG: MarR family transcriptional regulator, partial [Hyphomicrobiales bacterium]
MTSVDAQRISAIRRFNRFHTKLVGALDNQILSSSMPLPQVRILYELAVAEVSKRGHSSADLARNLSMDPGYLSRLVVDLEDKGYLTRKAPEGRGRRKALFLTQSGRDLASKLEVKSSNEVSELLMPLSDWQQEELVRSMTTIEGLLGNDTSQSAVVLRPPNVGDFGWIIYRHGLLYA